jgi:hypothetical protein
MTGKSGVGIGADGEPLGNVNSVRYMEQMKCYLTGFRTIDLKCMEAIKLMRRYDRKFIFHRDRLLTVLSFLKQNHQVLEIADNNIFTYDNLYYDTDDHFFYNQHHNKRMNRYKLRCRKYIDTDQCFFEIKFKDNKKKTIKNRFMLGNDISGNELPERSREFVYTTVLANGGKFIDKGIIPSLRIRFNRVTFADLVHKERLTFDMNLTYTDMRCNSKRIGNLIIAELKSENPSTSSPFFQYLKNIRIAPTGFSKYCMGIAFMEKDIKYNRFKGKLSKLENLM